MNLISDEREVALDSILDGTILPLEPTHLYPHGMLWKKGFLHILPHFDPLYVSVNPKLGQLLIEF